MSSNSDAWQEALDVVKAQSQILDVLPIMEDTMAQKVLISWPRIAIDHSKPIDPIPNSNNGIWRWLWLSVEFDINELASITAVHIMTATQKFNQLKGNRLIFPDGTISDSAQKLLRASATAKIKEMTS